MIGIILLMIGIILLMIVCVIVNIRINKLEAKIKKQEEEIIKEIYSSSNNIRDCFEIQAIINDKLKEYIGYVAKDKGERKNGKRK